MPQLDPGTSYVQVGASRGGMVIARVGPTSTYVTFANGCAGSHPAARLVPLDTPRIGATHEVNVLDVPAGAAFVLFGMSHTSPQSLATLGMPGCSLHVTADAAVVVTTTTGNARFQLPIPDVPALVGTHFFNQALILDPAAGNALGAVMSDAAEGVVGR